MAADCAATHRTQDLLNSPHELDCTSAALLAMEDADNRFRRELERVYGTEDAGDARYMLSHQDAAVQEASEAFVTASNAWHQVQFNTRIAGSSLKESHEQEA